VEWADLGGRISLGSIYLRPRCCCNWPVFHRDCLCYPELTCRAPRGGAAADGHQGMPDALFGVIIRTLFSVPSHMFCIASQSFLASAAINKSCCPDSGYLGAVVEVTLLRFIYCTPNPVSIVAWNKGVQEIGILCVQQSGRCTRDTKGKAESSKCTR
jgi:hypothetical protein